MMVQLDYQTEMVGRDNELKELQQYLDKAANGEGNTILISGEAGVGKTKLVNELKEIALSKGFLTLSGNSMYESLAPYIPFIEALRSGGLDHLFAEEAPRVEAVYLVSHSGLLIKEVVRQETELDPDLFASVLSTLGDFVSESLSKMLGNEKEGTLKSLGLGNYRILIESSKSSNVVVIITGKENEFLINDMKEITKEVEENFYSILKSWDGDEDSIIGVKEILNPLITSGKYDGVYYGKEDPKARRNLLFQNITLGLERQAKTIPILLCLEDLHWADPSSLALMHYISRTARENGLLILGTYRSEEVLPVDGKSHLLIDTMQRMDRESLYNEIRLNRLSRDTISKFCCSIFGDTEFTDNFYNRIHNESDGNPLFIIQLFKFLVDEKIIKKDNGKWYLIKELEEIDIPSKISNIILRRLNRIEKRDRNMLDYASVIGETFTSNLLCDVLNIKSILLLKQLTDLEQRHRLIRSYDGHWRFDHAKIKEVLYKEIPQELRMEYHGIIADSIETLNKDIIDDVIGDLAFHYYHCKSKQKALFYLLKAAEKAMKEYSNEEAIRFYRQALEFEDDDKKRMKIFESLGDVYSLISKYDNSVESFNNALDLTEDKKRKAENLAKIGGILGRKSEHYEAIRICNEALELVKDEECEEQALVQRNIGVSYLFIGELDRAQEFLENSRKIYEKFGDKKNIVVCLNDIGRVYRARCEFDSAVEHYNKALDISEEINDQEGIGLSLVRIGTIQHMRGYLHNAIEYYTKSLDIEQKIGNQAAIADRLEKITNTYDRMGEDEKAEEYFKKGRRIYIKIGDIKGTRWNEDRKFRWETLSKDDFDKAIEVRKKQIKFYEEHGLMREKLFSIMYLGGIYAEKGEFNEAEKYYRQALDLSYESGYKEVIGGVLNGFGMIFREKKMWKESLENIHKSIKLAKEMGMEAYVGDGYYELGLTYKAKGDIEEAKIHFNKAIEIYDQFNWEKRKIKINKALEEL